MLPHEEWVSAGLSGISKNTPVPHQCNSSLESESTMLRCYLKQQPIPSMKSLKSSDMITSCISVGFSTSWKDIHRENTESWETNSEIHKEDTTESSGQWFRGILFSLFYSIISTSFVFWKFSLHVHRTGRRIFGHIFPKFCKFSTGKISLQILKQ